MNSRLFKNLHYLSILYISLYILLVCVSNAGAEGNNIPAASIDGLDIYINDAEMIYEDWQIPFSVDGSFATLRKNDTELYYWHSFGNTNYKYYGPLNDPLQTVVWVKDDSELFDYNGKGDPFTDRILINNVYDMGNGRLLGFCHIEKFNFDIPAGDPGYVKYAIGLIYSTNNGDYWTYCGEIIRPQQDTSNIGGVPYLVVGDYFYVYFNEQPFNLDRRIGVARAKVNDVLNAAATGGVTLWNKYSNGTWTQDGLIGVGSNIVPDKVTGYYYDVHSDAAYNRVLGKYMLTVQTHNIGQLLLYTSTDGIGWENKIIVDETDDNNFIQAYSFFASLTDTTDDCREVGNKFYIIFPRKDWPDNYGYDELYRRLLTIDGPKSQSNAMTWLPLLLEDD